MVGTGGFEPPTPRTPSVCATRLRHVPTGEFLIIATKISLQIVFWELGLKFIQVGRDILKLIPDLDKDFF